MDVRGLTGFAAPDLLTRAGMVRRWARTAQVQVRLAVVSRPEIDDDALHGLEQEASLWIGPPRAF